MPDREKVIDALEHCELCACNNCPYNENGKGGWNCRQMHKDALALLKEQEAVVRCKDCKYCKRTEWNEPWYGSCRYFNTHSVDADGFCYKAERKDSD